MTLAHIKALAGLGETWSAGFREVCTGSDPRRMKHYLIPNADQYRVAHFAAGEETRAIDLQRYSFYTELSRFSEAHAVLMRAVEVRFGVKLNAVFGVVPHEERALAHHESSYNADRDNFGAYVGWFLTAPVTIGDRVHKKTCCINASCGRYEEEQYAHIGDLRFCSECGGPIATLETTVSERLRVTRLDVWNIQGRVDWDESLFAINRETDVDDCYIPTSSEFGAGAREQSLAAALVSGPAETAESFREQFADFIAVVEEKHGLKLQLMFGAVSFWTGPRHEVNLNGL
jgi:hypothetical protein